MTAQLTETVIVVTGAGRGLGRRIAEEFGALGASVAVNDINPDNAAETARRVEAAGGQANTYLADISKKFPVQALFNAIEDDWGKIDVLIHNARVIPQKPLLDMDEWDWRRTLDVNLTGAFALIQVAGRLMRAAGSGAIFLPIQIPAVSTNMAAYATTRHGLEGLAASATPELAAAGIALHALTYQEGEYEEVCKKIVGIVHSSQFTVHGS